MRLLNQKDAAAKFGGGRTKFHELRKLADFPLPIELPGNGKSKRSHPRWVEEELNQYIHKLSRAAGK